MSHRVIIGISQADRSSENSTLDIRKSLTSFSFCRLLCLSISNERLRGILMNKVSFPPNENRILSSLPAEDLERISPHLEKVDLYHGQILYHMGERIEYVYFPVNSMISLVSQMVNGGNVEVGVIGFEGMGGLPVVLGVRESPHQMMVQIHDGAMRMRVAELEREFKRGGALHDLLLRYTQSLMIMTSQAAACNAAHGLSERLARWLLMSHDRCVGDELPLTQDFISLMLGVRRAGVSETASILQNEGLIKYRRGHITILDREGLEDYACECYGIIKMEFDRGGDVSCSQPGSALSGQRDVFTSYL